MLKRSLAVGVWGLGLVVATGCSGEDEPRSGNKQQALHIDFGSWEPVQYTTNGLPVHAALSRNNLVEYFGGSQNEPGYRWGIGLRAWFDPATGTNSYLAPPTVGGQPYDAFCSGHTFNYDADLIVAGGHETYNFTGLRWTSKFRG